MAASSSYQKRECLLATLQRMLNNATQRSEECCIYRVPELLRGLNPTVYTPMAFPIGPIHNKDHGHDSSEADHPELVSNRLYKLKFLKSFFQKQQNDPQAFWHTVRRRITDIRRCYAYYDKIFEDDDVFTDMILLDCIFVIQLFLEHEGGREESISMAPLKLKEIASDLILAENQLPFFILEELYQKFQSNGTLPATSDLILAENKLPSFEDIACRFLKLDSIRDADAADHSTLLWFPEPNSIRDKDGRKPFHILDMLRNSLLPPLRRLFANDPYFLRTVLKRPYNDNDIDLQEIMCPTATSLFEAGIKFRVQDDAFSILDIRFDMKKGILYIPKLRVDDGTERKFRNLIAFEQSHTKDNRPRSEIGNLRQSVFSRKDDSEFSEASLLQVRRAFKHFLVKDPGERTQRWDEIISRDPEQFYPLLRKYTYVTDYQFFMDCLINTAKDVQLLTKAGIIENWLGSDNNLCELINSMGIHAYHFTGGYLYSDIARALNKYHKKKWNRYKAILNQGYLSHPFCSFTSPFDDSSSCLGHHCTSTTN